jgi:hypothetical protein
LPLQAVARSGFVLRRRGGGGRFGQDLAGGLRAARERAVGSFGNLAYSGAGGRGGFVLRRQM